MATLNEIVYNIRNIAYSGTNNSEQDLGTRQIKFWVHYTRAKLLKQMAANGKQLPYICFQRYALNHDMEHHMTNTLWNAYVNTNTNSSTQFIAVSDRTVDAAGIGNHLTLGNQYHNEDFYGRDFFNYDTNEDKDEYGRLIIELPPLLNINNNFGFAELSLRYRQEVNNQLHSAIPVSVVSKDEARAKKYNRFTKAIYPVAYIDHYLANINSSDSESNYKLVIEQLRSVFRKASSTVYDDPIKYGISVRVCLQNPTQAVGWNDDHTYPIPEFMVKDLTQGVLQELQVQLNAPSDKITDNADTTKLIQPQAHK
tara:strand:- start:138 stop:1070 length:933 start_codon:yes stop_codon:yes gene_type:complete